MSFPGGFERDETRPAACAADGPVSPGRSVVEAVECNTARFVDLVGEAGGVAPAYLVLTDADGPSASLTPTDVFGLPELQNALAYFGRGVDSVRVRTWPDRGSVIGEHVGALSAYSSLDAFEFGGRRFALEVVRG